MASAPFLISPAARVGQNAFDQPAVEIMAAPESPEMPNDAVTGKPEISRQVQYLVPHRFIIEPKPFPVENTLAANDDGVGQGTAASEAVLLQVLYFGKKSEGPCRDILVEKLLLTGNMTTRLAGNCRMAKNHRAGDLKIRGGIDGYAAPSFRDAHRSGYDEENPWGGLFQSPRRKHRLGENEAAAVQYRQFGPIDLGNYIIDLSCMAGRQKMLHGGNGIPCRADCGRKPGIYHIADSCMDRDRRRYICPHEENTAIDGGRLDKEIDRPSRMEADAVEADAVPESALERHVVNSIITATDYNFFQNAGTSRQRGERRDLNPGGFLDISRAGLKIKIYSDRLPVGLVPQDKPATCMLLYAASAKEADMPENRENRPLGELFSELSQELRTLFQQEMDLFRTEMQSKMVQMVKDVAALGIGGILLYSGFLTLIAAIVFGVAEFIPLWLAALLVAIVFLAVGFAFVQKGRKELTKMKMMPEKSAETLKETARWAKTLK